MTVRHLEEVRTSIGPAGENGTPRQQMPATFVERAESALARARAYTPLLLPPRLVQRSCGHFERDLTAVSIRTPQPCMDCFDPNELFPERGTPA